MLAMSPVLCDDFNFTSCVARPNVCGLSASHAPLDFSNLSCCGVAVAAGLKTQVYDRIGFCCNFDDFLF